MALSIQNTFPLPIGVFLLLRDIIHERIGIWFEEEKLDLLADKLSYRVSQQQLRSFLEYYFLLKHGKNRDEEWLLLTEALSVQETYFWREIDQIRTLVDVLIPQHDSRERGPIRIWTAACATGEEPFTIAMALNESGWFDRADIQIWASDVSIAALDKAKAGTYRERSFRTLPPALRSKYFTPSENGWQIEARLKSRVTFKQANLLDPQDISDMSSAGYIFCRNVFIYFSSETIGRVASFIASRMPRPGYFFTGAAESLLRMRTPFELDQLNNSFVYLVR